MVTQTSWAGSIYVVERHDGSVTFTSKKPQTGSYKILNTQKPTAAFSYRGVKSAKSSSRSYIQKDKFHSLIEYEAKRAGVDISLVKAVIHVESAFNPRARSHKGAMGLMQLMPDTARMLGVKNPYHPQDNIQGGVKFLARLLNKYNGNLGLSLAAYNAGEMAVKKYGGIPPFNETINYVRKVVELRSAYKVSRG